MSNSFTITGHRGTMATEPENTMRSFRKAVELGVDELELDVHLSLDGELVIIHDPTLDRTTDRTGTVADMTWDELATVDAGEGEQIPRLAQVLDAFPDTPIQLEIKALAAIPGVLAALRERRDRIGPITLTSFKVDAVRAVMVEDRTWQVGLICGAKEAEKAAVAVELGTDWLYLHWKVTDAPAVREFTGRIAAWPSRDEEQVRRAIAEGYAGTTCDDPAMGLRVRDSMVAI